MTVFNKGAARIYGAEFGLTSNEWRLVALVHAAGELSMGRLASQAQFDPGLTSRLVASLVKRGCFRRRVDGRDARGVVLCLTSAGRDLVARVFPVAWARNDELLSCLTPVERRIVIRSIDKLNRQARLMLEEGA